MPKRSRRLWLQIKVYAPNVSQSEVKRTLIRAIENGTYTYPKGWKVGLYWRNSIRGPMRSGEFTAEMKASRESSPGFDFAVIDYLENQ